jgi:hypothetical protein
MTNNLLCYLCGRENPDSRDHVPARALFYPRLPDDLMTAPAHRSCQGRYAPDEAYFAEILDSARLGGGAGWLDRWTKAPAKTARRPSPQRVEIDRMEAVIKKIVQGLHYRHTGSLLPPEAQMTITPERWHDNQVTLRSYQFQSRGSHGEFKYAHTDQNHGITTWILIFHEQFSFQCDIRF